MRVRRFISLLWILAFTAGARAQLSLSSAVNLALQNSPRIRMGQADVERVRASLQETRDVFIPTVGISGGIGKSTGPPLAVPQVFTVSAQSLIFNFSERDYIRSAHASLLSTQLSLEDTRNAVTEDVVNTYLALDNAVQRQAAAKQAQAAVDRLGEIVEGRFANGVDPHIEVTRARRTGLIIQRQTLNTADEIDTLGEHLSNLVGIRLTGADMVHSSIPSNFPHQDSFANDSPGLRSAQANAAAKSYIARAQSQYLYRPQFGFVASYSYISTAFTNYDLYYTAFTRSANSNPNALSLGVQVSVPLLDFAHRARAREARADASHAREEFRNAHNEFTEGNGKSVRAQQQLALGAALAGVERDMAKDELDAVLVQLQAGAGEAGGPQLSPKDEQNARLQVQQRTLEMLNAELQLQQLEVTLMRQQGTLTTWVRSAADAVPTAPSSVSIAPVARPTQ